MSHNLPSFWPPLKRKPSGKDQEITSESMLGRRYSRKRRIQEAVAGIVLFDKERLIRDIVLFYLLEALPA